MRPVRKIVCYVLQKILFFLAASALVFLLVHSMPGSPVQVLLSMYQLPATPENVAFLSEKWGLDQPLPVQYLRWLRQFLAGDWGVSLITGRPVRDELLVRLPWSLFMGMTGVLSGIALSLALGYLAAAGSRAWERLSRLWAVAVQSCPAFLLAVFCMYILGVKYPLLHFFSKDLVSNVLLGAGIIAFYETGRLSRVVREQVLAVMKETYAVSALTRGFSTRRIVLRQAWRPVLYGLLAAAAADFAWVIGGTAVMEVALTVPGVSVFCVESVNHRDYAVLQSFLSLLVLWMFAVHAFFDAVLWRLRKRGAA